MIILCITLFPKDRAHALPAEIGTTSKPTPVTDNVYTPLTVFQNFINSGNVDKICLGFLEATAMATFAVMAKARLGYFNIFFAIFFDTLSPFLP